MGRGQVVQQHPVGDLARQGEHLRAECPEHDLRSGLVQPDPQAKAVHLVVVTGEIDLLSAQTLAQQGDELADLGEGVGPVLGSVPAGGDHRRGDADPDEHAPARLQRLERGRSHRQQGRGTELQGEHAGPQIECGRGLADGAQQSERLQTDGLGGPERRKAELIGSDCRADRLVRSERHEARRSDSDGGHGQLLERRRSTARSYRCRRIVRAGVGRGVVDGNARWMSTGGDRLHSALQKQACSPDLMGGSPAV